MGGEAIGSHLALAAQQAPSWKPQGPLPGSRGEYRQDVWAPTAPVEGVYGPSLALPGDTDRLDPPRHDPPDGQEVQARPYQVAFAASLHGATPNRSRIRAATPDQ
jgi:hypothetical protein